MLELRASTGVVAILTGGFLFGLICLNQRARFAPSLPAWPVQSYPALPAARGGTEYALYVPGSGFSHMSVPRWNGLPAHEGPGIAG